MMQTIALTLSEAAAPPGLDLAIRVHRGRELEQQLPRWERYVRQERLLPLSRHPAWLGVLRRGLRHETYCLEAVEGETTHAPNIESSVCVTAHRLPARSTTLK